MPSPPPAVSSSHQATAASARGVGQVDLPVRRRDEHGVVRRASSASVSMCQRWSLSTWTRPLGRPAGGTARGAARRPSAPPSSSAARRRVEGLPAALRAGAPRATRLGRQRQAPGHRLLQRPRAGAHRQRRRPAAGAYCAGAAPAPWPTTASARSRARTSRSPAFPQPDASMAARTRAEQPRWPVARSSKKARPVRDKITPSRPSVTPKRRAPPRRRGRRSPPRASPCASPRTRPAGHALLGVVGEGLGRGARAGPSRGWSPTATSSAAGRPASAGPPRNGSSPRGPPRRSSARTVHAWAVAGVDRALARTSPMSSTSSCCCWALRGSETGIIGRTGSYHTGRAGT
jgi:hypothetical protein